MKRNQVQDHPAEIEPPQAIDAERALLSSLMRSTDDKGTVAAVRAVIDQRAFYQIDHGIIFGAICRLDDAGRPVDLVSVGQELANGQLLMEIGGAEHLGRIFESHFTASAAMHYAKLVAESAKLRQVIAVCDEAGARAFACGRGETSDQVIQATIDRLTSLQASGQATRIHPLGELATDVLEQIESGGVPLIKTGFRDLDDSIKGIALGEMMVVGARPSMGKSLLLKQIGIRAAKRGDAVGYISLEEGGFKIARNLLSSEANIDNHRLRDGSVAPHEWKPLTASVAQLMDLPFYVCQDAFRVEEIAAVARMMKNRYGIKMLILDYLQKVRGGTGRSRYEQVTDVSQYLSLLLKRLDVAGVVAAQLKRISERGEAPRPRMDDLRESGQIEQDADLILLLHREDYYRRGEQGYEPTWVAELLNEKVRDGPCRDVLLRSVLKYQRFEDADDSDHQRHRASTGLTGPAHHSPSNEDDSTATSMEDYL